uniref:Uncharacterized protein n=1 Tax=Oryza meridionalis TaxID=40149 RepID=A0A0E0DLS6_9ORYZ
MAAAPPSDSEVRVQKVDKLDLVFNILTKPPVYGAGKGNNPPKAAAPRRPAATGGDHGSGVSGGRKQPGVVSIEDINKRSENYIRDRKRMFFGQN